MTTAELLSTLRQSSVRVWLDGDQLRCSAPKGTLTVALREELARQKADIVSFLNGVERATRQVLAGIEPLSKDRPLPLSFAQQRIWFADQLEPGNPAYNVPQALRVAGPLSIAGLEHSLGEVVRRHQVLRSTFKSLDGDPMQSVAAPKLFGLDLVDLGGLPAESLVRVLADEEGERRFDLERDPMLRARLLLVKREEQVILLSMHHIASDLWSMSILVNEVSSLYGAYSGGAASQLSELKIQYADYASWQRGWLDDVRIGADVVFWKRKLRSPLPRIELAADNSTPTRSDRSQLHYFHLPELLSSKLKETCLVEGVTPFMLMLAGFNLFLRGYTGQDDILVCSQTAGRNRVELEALIGYFVNQLVLRTDLSGDPTLRQLIERVRAVCLEAFDHQDLPFDRLVEELKLDRDSSGLSLSRIVFGLQALPQTERAPLVEGLSIGRLEDTRTRSRAELVLLVWENGQSVEGSFEYDTGLFSADQISEMAEYYATALQAIVDNPDSTVSSLPAPVRLPAVEGASKSIGELYARSNLTMNQILFWLGQKLHPDEPMFNMVIVYRISGHIDLSVFRRAFQLVLRSSDALRTVITETDGIPRQNELDLADYQMERLDFSHDEDPELRLTAWVEERKRRRLDFDRCLFDSALIKLSDDRHAWYTNQHHIICDAWSTGLTFERQARFYDRLINRRRGRGPIYPQFAEYVAAERLLTASDLYAEARAYWEHRLSLPSEPMTFYGRHTGGHVVTINRISRELDEAQCKRLRSKARSRPLYSGSVNATLGNMFLGLLSVFLHRVSGNSTIIVGAAMHNRRTDETRDSIGLFMRFLPLRIQIEPADTFTSVVQKVKTEFLTTRKYSECTIVGSHSLPAYNVLSNFITAAYGKFGGKPIQAQWVNPGSGAESLALHVHDLDSSGAFTLEFDFDTKIFDQSLQDDVIRHFNKLIEALLEDDSRIIGDLSLLTEREARQILLDFNRTRMECPVNSIAAILGLQTALRADAIAASFNEHALSYESLDRVACQTANKLVSLNLGPESLVAILVERGLGFLAATLGAFKLGAAYLPLDPTLPPQRLARIIARSRASVILISRDMLDLVTDLLSELQASFEDGTLQALPNLLIHEETPQPERESDAGVCCGATQANLAYVIYTSGSTGEPKGVMIEQRGMINHLYAKIAALSLTEADVVAQTASQSFDISVWQHLAGLVVGGKVVILEDAVAHEPQRLMDATREAQVTVLEIVPAMLGAILFEESNNQKPAWSTSLRWLMLTGEALAPDLCRQWLTRHRQIPIINAYGPTECSDDVTHWIVIDPPDDEAVYVPIGMPVGNLRLYTVDSQILPLPYTMPGELLAGGAGVGRGYLGDPATTAASFIPDPFFETAGARLYRTGDIARIRAGNSLEFIGRLDSQIKLRGNRIELGEIEAELAAHPGVREAAVVVHTQAPENTQIVAYFVTALDPAPAGWELRGYLQQRLPEYMVPEVLIALDEFPRTNNGKIDRRALRAEHRVLARTENQHVGPHDMLELKLLTIWQDVLGVKEFGVTANFFDLGGHSLMAVRLMAQIRRWLGRELPLADFFQGPTIEHLAEAIRKQKDPVEPSPLVPIQPHGSSSPFFCVHPGSGDIFYYIGLARHMPRNRPFFGLQDPKLYLDCDPFTPLREMAALYVRAIRSVQPDGPYMLGGWSFGGHVAFEMAQQLKEQGQKVGLLAIIDTGTQEFLESRFADADSAKLLAMIACESAPEAGRTFQEMTEDIRSFGDSKEQVEYVAGILKKHNKLALPEYADNYLLRALQLFETRIRIMKDYSPSAYTGQITLLQASDKVAGIEPDEEDPSWGWSKLCSQRVRVVSIPGNHATLGTEPHVGVLANRLAELIAEAEHSSSATASPAIPALADRPNQSLGAV
ncbi:MAG TPA: amino acid adenylation domain-containing protein [Blastocatellia bacterium]